MSAARSLLGARPAGEFVRVRPLNLLKPTPDLDGLQDFDRHWRWSRGAKRLPSLVDLRLGEMIGRETRLIYGGFVGSEVHSFRCELFGSELRLPPGRNDVVGRTMAELPKGPYFAAMMRDYEDVRFLAVPRWREVYAELPGPAQSLQVLHYRGGIWPVSNDGRRISGLVMISRLVAPGSAEATEASPSSTSA